MLVLVCSAYATNPGRVAAGWPIPARDDAPTDADLLFAATYALSAVVTSGPGAPETLPSEVEVPSVAYGQAPHVVFHPPAAGWAPGAAYTVEAVDDPYGTATVGTYPLSFTVGDAPAADPVLPEVTAVQVGAWSPEGAFPFGNGAPVRSVEITVRSSDPDPWSFVELVGHFRGGQLTTEPIWEHLALGVGPGPHTLAYTQWRDELGDEPSCFGLVGVAPDGDRSAEVPLCLDAGELPGPGDTGDGVEEDDAVGCATAPGGAWWAAVLALALRRRRLRAEERGGAGARLSGCRAGPAR